MKKITYLELLNLIKENKQPKEIIYNKNKYIWQEYDYHLDFGTSLSKTINYCTRSLAFVPIIEIIEDILDKTEKRWLKHFIKSTKIKVKYIKKWLGASCENEYLQIVYDVFNHEYNEDRQGNLYLPIFKKGSMYKGMELDKEYSLKELGLE